MEQRYRYVNWNEGPLHRISDKLEKKLTIFICINEEEFRCDVNADCDDKSDEVSCQIVHLEPGYFKESAVFTILVIKIIKKLPKLIQLPYRIHRHHLLRWEAL